MEYKDILKKIRELPNEADEEKIGNTAHELEMLSFNPLLLIDTPRLLYMNRSDIIAEAERVASLTPEQLPDFDRESIAGPEDFKHKHLSMLYFNYELLSRLRAGNPEAWDYVHELYEDD